MPLQTRGTRAPSRREGAGLATALGWFSIGLGLAELVAPQRMARMIGVRDDEESRNVMRAVGAREIASGIGLLSQPAAARWAWSRVAGDAMDLTLLGRALTSDSTQRNRTTAATAAVIGISALDVYAGRRLSRAEPARRLARVTRSITIGRSPEEVYRFWHDFENLPRFMRYLESVRVTGDRRSHWTAKMPTGMRLEWDAEITEDRPNELIAWRSLEGSEVRTEGAVRFREAPGGRGTEVVVNLSYQPPGGVVTTKLAQLFRAIPDYEIERELRAFKQVMETGEVLVSDATVRPGPHPAVPPAEEELRA
ncbi:MAG TPA: SRPBCC family protein [Gemmatimonadaceae bacterium]|nr:SRPBCC family protein [Gemmatimonadaceae bacterium]